MTPERSPRARRDIEGDGRRPILQRAGEQHKTGFPTPTAPILRMRLDALGLALPARSESLSACDPARSRAIISATEDVDESWKACERVKPSREFEPKVSERAKALLRIAQSRPIRLHAGSAFMMPDVGTTPRHPLGITTQRLAKEPARTELGSEPAQSSARDVVMLLAGESD